MDIQTDIRGIMMENTEQANRIKCKIKITHKGPYLVYGSIPIEENIITPKNGGYEFKPGRSLPQAENYALCRCGKSGASPFCDGTHKKINFEGLETASRVKYHDRAKLLTGPGIDLLDDERCAFARFCHTKRGNVWDLTRKSNKADNRDEAIKAANDCPAGRLTAVDKDGKEHEPVYKPSIVILQDPEKDVSGGIFVRGYVQIEGADGDLYEKRNRVVLCRCGKSKNKPFCDASHLAANYLDN
jgi:CDGSH-type Zn-finger protein